MEIPKYLSELQLSWKEVESVYMQPHFLELDRREFLKYWGSRKDTTGEQYAAFTDGEYAEIQQELYSKKFIASQQELSREEALGWKFLHRWVSAQYIEYYTQMANKTGRPEVLENGLISMSIRDELAQMVTTGWMIVGICENQSDFTDFNETLAKLRLPSFEHVTAFRESVEGLLEEKDYIITRDAAIQATIKAHNMILGEDGARNQLTAKRVSDEMGRSVIIWASFNLVMPGMEIENFVRENDRLGIKPELDQFEGKRNEAVKRLLFDESFPWANPYDKKHMAAVLRENYETYGKIMLLALNTVSNNI